MKSFGKPSFLLLCLVLGIYMMRNADVSFGDIARYPYRVLDGPRPTTTLCNGVTDIGKAFTESEIKRAQGFKDSLQGMRNGNPLKKILYNNIDASVILSDYVVPLIPFVAPWAVMLVITLITVIVLCCNWCCIYGCCKNKNGCKICKAPKNANRKRIYIALSAFFLLGTVGSGIAGIVVSGQVPTGMELTICSALSVLEDLTYGVKSQHWQGVDGAVANLRTLKNNLNTAATALSTSSGSTSDVVTAYNAVSARLDTMISNLKTGTPTVNPNVARPAFDQTGTYMPTYIANLDPKSNPSSFTGMIEAEISIRKNVLVNAQPMINTAVSVIKGPPGISSVIDIAADQADNVSSMMKDALNSMADFGSIGKDVIKGIGMGLTAIFIANLVLAIFGIASMIMVGVMKVKFFNKFLHMNWCVLLILTILGWILSLITFPTSVVLMEACDVLGSALNDANEAVKMKNPLGDEVGGILYTCVHGNGQLGAMMKLDDALKDFKTIYDQFDLISAQMPLANSPPASITIPRQVTSAGEFKAGKVADAPEIVADLTALNRAVNASSNPCTNLYDQWQLHSDSCSTGTKFTSSDADTAYRGSPVCIGLVDAWTPPKSSVNRYTAVEFPPSCGTGANQAYTTNTVTRFKNNRNTINSLFTNVENELSAVQTSYNNFANKMQVVLNDFVYIKTALTSVQDSLQGPENGLITNLNCAFAGNGLRRVSDAMCVGFISGMYQSSVVIIITSTMTFFSLIFVFCLAKRFLIESEANPKPV